MLEIEINGQKIEAEEDAMIIEVADRHGIYIPRFCYHKKLSIAANCRMCLVEVEKVGKPLPACATPITPDMKVFTQSDMALNAQRAVMEFLLINHPLDCPICDQGGVCELQDLAMGYGRPYSYYTEGKRAVFNDDLGPLIETEMTRCIHCTRCVRFGEEIANLRELGATGRGEDMEIGTYVKHFMQSEVSGNIIDLCPVGALTAKPSRYEARGFELREHPSIGAHDCVGANTYIQSRGQEYVPQRFVMKVVPRDNEATNEIWMSDRDRFSFEGLSHQDRVFKPRLKKAGAWVEVEWREIIPIVVQKIQMIIEKKGAHNLAALASTNSTTEEFYLLQKLMRALGSNNIDHRIRTQDFSDQHLTPEFPNMGPSISELEDQDVILLVGSDIRNEQPLINLRFNKALQDDTKMMVINPLDYPTTFKCSEKIISLDMIQVLAAVAKVLTEKAGQPMTALNDVIADDQAIAVATMLKSAEKAVILLGAFANDHPQAADLRKLVRIIGEFSGARIGVFSDGANTSGAWLAGAIGHRGAANAKVSEEGLHAQALLTTNPVSAYCLLGIEPEYDCAYSSAALATLKQADFVVCINTFTTKAMLDYADVILPMAPYTESAGTFVNINGEWQSFDAVSVPHGESKPAWKILRLLAKMFELDGFGYPDSQAIRDELKQKVQQIPAYQPQEVVLETLPAVNNELIRLAPWHMYRADPLVRRAGALQAVRGEDQTAIIINQMMADHLKLVSGDRVSAIQNENRITLPLIINNRLADNVVLIPSGLDETAGFGQAFSSVELIKES